MPDELEQVVEQEEPTQTGSDELEAFESDDELGLGEKPEEKEPEKEEPKVEPKTEPDNPEVDPEDPEKDPDNPEGEVEEDDDVKRGKEIIEQQKAEQERQEKEQKEKEAAEKNEEPAAPDLRNESFSPEIVKEISGFVPKNLLPKGEVELEDGTTLNFDDITKEYPELPVMIAAISNNIVRQMVQSGYLVSEGRYQSDSENLQKTIGQREYERIVTHPVYGVPEARKIVQGDEFKKWIKGEPDEIKALYEVSRDPWDMVKVLKRFKGTELLGDAKEKAAEHDEKRKSNKDVFDGVHKSTVKSKGTPKQSRLSGKEEEAAAFYGDDEE
jgi:hypothetical protein